MLWNKTLDSESEQQTLYKQKNLQFAGMKLSHVSSHKAKEEKTSAMIKDKQLLLQG